MRWPSGRASDSGARGRGFYTYLRRVVSLSKDTFTPRKVLVIPRKRWLRPDMTEKLFTGTLSLNKTKPKQTQESLVSFQAIKTQDGLKLNTVGNLMIKWRKIMTRSFLVVNSILGNYKILAHKLFTKCREIKVGKNFPKNGRGLCLFFSACFFWINAFHSILRYM